MAIIPHYNYFIFHSWYFEFQVLRHHMHHLSLYYFLFVVFTLMQFPKLLEQMYSTFLKT